MIARLAALLLAVAAGAVRAEPVTVASGAYPEGLLWHGGRMLFAEMGADRISIIDNGVTRGFWSDPGCGPTAISPFGPSGYLVNCHLGRHLVEISADGVTGRRLRTAAARQPITSPNASTSDGQGGVYFSDSGIFSVRAPATGRVYHVTAMGVMTEVVSGLRYANGVAFDLDTRTLFVSEHLARRIVALTLDARHRVTQRRVFADFASHDATKSYSFSEAGPDGLTLRSGLLVVAEYGEGRVHLFGRDGKHLKALKVPMPFVDTVAFDGAGNLYAGGALQNTRPPFEGAVVRFAPSDWQP